MKHSSAPAHTNYQLRHRLAGAVIVVSVAAAGIPWLLSTPQPGAQVGKTVLKIDIDNVQKALENNTKNSDDISAIAADFPPPPPTSTSGWAVNIGVFGKRANVEAMVKALTRLGYRPHEIAVKTKDGEPATRVWLGPYADKKTAGEVEARLKSLTGEPGQVVEQTPR